MQDIALKMQNISVNIKGVRKRKGLTQEELAGKSGISKRMIAYYEANENDIPFQKVQNIATALGVNIIDLINWKNYTSYKLVNSHRVYTGSDTLEQIEKEYMTNEQADRMMDLFNTKLVPDLQNRD